jgi:biotin carboxylase
MSALNSDASVWKQLSDIKSVKLFSSTNETPITSNRRASKTVIIPLMESHLYEMPTNFTSLTSTPALVRLMADKLMLTKNLAAHGFDQFVPRTWTNHADSTFPCILKRRDLNGGQGIRILKSANQLQEFLTELEFQETQYFFQELISAKAEYVCHIVALKGEILFSNNFAYTMPDPEMIRGSSSHITFTNLGSILDQEVHGTFKKIIKHLNYSGPCNIDFKLINGVPKIFEINPRLGGSLMINENLPVLKNILNTIVINAI